MSNPPPEAGMRLNAGKIELLDPIGRGGGGWVFRARSRGHDEPVAVKLTNRPDSLLRFVAEAEFLSQVDHPRVVKVYEHGQDSGWVWYSMPIYPSSLAAEIRKAHPAVPRAIEWCIQTLEGLATLHKTGLVHRDIKPDNLFLNPRNEVVIGDLGAARQPIGSVGWQTRTGSYLGSFDYVAPEQAEDAKRVDRRADLYAVGATLYRLTANRRPGCLFMADQLPGIYAALPTPILEPVVRLLCAHAPEDRPPTARAAAEMILAAMDSIRSDNGLPPVKDTRLIAFDSLAPREGWLRIQWQRLLERIDGR